MIRSEINFHRYLAFSIRNAYMNYVYQGEIVNEITGIKDDTDKTANPLPKIPEFKSSLSFDQKKSCRESISRQRCRCEMSASALLK